MIRYICNCEKKKTPVKDETVRMHILAENPYQLPCKLELIIRKKFLNVFLYCCSCLRGQANWSHFR